MISNQRVVVITGCSSGFGYLTALKFSRHPAVRGCARPYLVYAGVRNPESAGALELKNTAAEENLDLRLIKIDVTDDQSVTVAVDIVKQAAGRVDILVNNAGFGYLGPVETFTINEVKDQFETNVFGLLRMVKAVVPLMRDTDQRFSSDAFSNGKRTSLIVNISSINGLVPFPLFAVYSASKHAVEALSEGLRFELLPFGIRVVLIEPGSFMTKFTDNRRSPLSMSAPDNPYRKLIDSFLRRYERMSALMRPAAVARLPRRGLLAMTEKAGLLAMTGKITAPQKVADLIFKIANEKNPHLRYRIGMDAQLYYWLHRLLPAWVWEWLLRRAYQW